MTETQNKDSTNTVPNNGIYVICLSRYLQTAFPIPQFHQLLYITVYQLLTIYQIPHLNPFPAHLRHFLYHYSILETQQCPKQHINSQLGHLL